MLKKGVPGPGAYDVKTKSNLPNVKIGNAARVMSTLEYRLNHVSGPGDFHADANKLSRTSPKFSFGHERKEVVQTMSTSQKFMATYETKKYKTVEPGPGAHAVYQNATN